MKLVLQDGKYSRHSRGSFHHLVYIGHASPEQTIRAPSVGRHPVRKPYQSAKATEFSRTVAFAQLKTNDVRALDNDVDIVVTGPTNADAKTSIDQIVFKNDTMTAPKTVADSSYSGIALDHVLNVGKDSRIAVTSYRTSSK
jgi:hypothetical protein